MMRTRTFLAAGAAGAICVATLPALGADLYFDSVAGDDGKDGKSEANAKKTLSLSGASGNTVHLKRGSTWTMSLNANNVTITTYGDGPRPVIVGTLTVSSSVVEGLGIQIPTTGTKAVNGVNVNSNSTVRDCDVDGTGAVANVGFGIMGENNKIIGNSVHDLGWSQSGGSMDNSGGAEGYMVMASNNEVAFNSAVNCQSKNATLGGNEGGCLEIVNGKAGSTISNVSFHHNYCEKSVGLWEGCSGDFSASGGGIQENHGIIENVTVSYNVSVDSMWLYLLQPVNTDFKNVVFANNTIIHTPRSAEYWDSGGGHFMMALAVADYTNNATGTKYTTDNEYYKKDSGFQPGTIIVKNNIFVDDISSTRNMMFMHNVADHSNNLFVPANASVGSLTLDASEKKVSLADLAFTDDYRLTANSKAAIDQATAISMAANGSLAASALKAALFETTFNQDIDQHAVPCGAAPDIGASEYCEGAGGSAGVGSSSVTKGGASNGTASSGVGAASSGSSKAGKGGATSKDTVSNGNATSTGNTSNGGAASNSSNANGDSGSSNPSNSNGNSGNSNGSGDPASDDTTANTGGRTGTSSKSSTAAADADGTGAPVGGNGQATAAAHGAAGSETGGCACRMDGQGANPTRAALGLLAVMVGMHLRRRRRAQ
ncbi:MAG TPA: MYXO-CTERM sorting domain-containing protein [Polyangiaceae bacterium]|nr:MYXO-CTERM sorting domain-containing protein [Polyangiaceae bacterium]